MNINKITIIILLFVSSTNIYSKTFNANDLLDPAFSSNCLDYCVDGVCWWLKCSFWGCSINTTPHIKHNLPDFVVSSYNNAKENPFDEVRALDVTNLSGGNQKTQNNGALKFKETSVIGNPIAYVMGQQRYFCKSNTNPYQPYYLSTVDHYLWRSGLTELIYPSSWIPGTNEVGSRFYSWGSIYPRKGFIEQANDIKTAAVTAARALDIVTKGGAHIYYPSAGDFKENGKWQMISPEKENSCTVFGDKEPELNKLDNNGQYAWTAWRNYNCCIPGRGWHIGTTITGCLINL